MRSKTATNRVRKFPRLRLAAAAATVGGVTLASVTLAGGGSALAEQRGHSSPITTMWREVSTLKGHVQRAAHYNYVARAGAVGSGARKVKGSGTTTTTTPTTTPPPTTTTPAATTTTPAATTATTSRSGPVTAGDSKTNCIFTGASGWAAGLASAQSATGMTFNCIETFIDANSTWSDWTNPWIANPSWGFTSWLEANPNRSIVISMNLIPDAVANASNPLTWETACQQGQYNTYATQLATNLVAAHMGSAVIRLGKEMNGPWENDFMGTTTTEQQAWAGCFAREVTAMRAVSGAHFLFDWNVNACVENFPLSNWYPGNAYVDIIGIDTYDAFCNGTTPTSSAATTQSLFAEPLGLNAVQAFATQQGKPMSIPEWGTQTGGGGLGDDPYYVSGVGQYVAANNVSFQAWFDNNGSSINPLTSGYPFGLGAYVHTFG
ncbi:MAG: hypothetical protein JWO62_3122 [Acidimicrobiaceae bacterium]|nr:hypothetical protein [Acidimicrobiaceae bacterium]